MKLLNRHIKRGFTQHLGSADFRILRGIGLVSTFLIIGKLAGAFKEVAIAYRYGISELLDVYLLAFIVVTWLPGIWVSILQSIYIPLINKTRHQEQRAFAEQFHGFSIIFAIATSILIPIFLYFLAAPLTENLSDRARYEFLYSSVLLVPVTGISILIGTYSFQLLAKEHHVNTLLEVLPSLTLAMVMLLPLSFSSTNPLLIGTIIGLIAQCVGLLIVLKKANIYVKCTFSFSSKTWVAFRSSIGILIASNVIMSFVDPISTYLAAQLGSGNVASLSYTNRILMLFLTLGAISISRSILPVLSDSAHNPIERYAITRKWTVVLFVAGTLGGLLCWIFAPYLVEVLFSRGKFSQENATTISRAVQLGIAQFPIYFAGTVIVQLCASLQLYRAIFYSSLIALTSKTLFSVLLIPYFSFSGIVLATVPMYFCTTSFFLVYLERLKRNGYFDQ